MDNHVNEIKRWFELAIPSPTNKNRAVQLGCHLEEIAEMLEATGGEGSDIHYYVKDQADHMKKTAPGGPIDDPRINREDLLDSLCDQIVTAIGVAHMFKLDIIKGLTKVNESNYSKFDEQGKPIFDANGKLAKGPNYKKADLSDCV